jgi:hypothetical protein
VVSAFGIVGEHFELWIMNLWKLSITNCKSNLNKAKRKGDKIECCYDII